MFNQKNVIGFSKETGVLGAIGEISYLNGTVTLVDDNEELHVVSLDSVVFLEEVGTIGEVVVFNRDVLGTIDGKRYEVELQSNGKDVILFLLDDKLNRLEEGEIIEKSNLSVLEPYVTLLGSIFELELELPVVDFNIKIVKDFNGQHFTYFYACNNKETGEIDLIKVVFIGATLLEEDYARTTLTHEEFLDAVANGTLKEVSPQELMNYATGMRKAPAVGGDRITTGTLTASKGKVTISANEVCCDEDEEDEEVDSSYCEECGEHETDCDCVWN